MASSAARSICRPSRRTPASVASNPRRSIDASCASAGANSATPAKSTSAKNTERIGRGSIARPLYSVLREFARSLFHLGVKENELCRRGHRILLEWLSANRADAGADDSFGSRSRKGKSRDGSTPHVVRRIDDEAQLGD